ncbi:hypothetical protein D9M68_750870 [compost metagenome]
MTRRVRGHESPRARRGRRAAPTSAMPRPGTHAGTRWHPRPAAAAARKGTQGSRPRRRRAGRRPSRGGRSHAGGARRPAAPRTSPGPTHEAPRTEPPVRTPVVRRSARARRGRGAPAGRSRKGDHGRARQGMGCMPARRFRAAHVHRVGTDEHRSGATVYAEGGLVPPHPARRAGWPLQFSGSVARPSSPSVGGKSLHDIDPWQ